MLTPEESIHIQNAIGADIMMQLDDVVDVKETEYQRFKLATERFVSIYPFIFLYLIHCLIILSYYFFI